MGFRPAEPRHSRHFARRPLFGEETLRLAEMEFLEEFAVELDDRDAAGFGVLHRANHLFRPGALGRGGLEGLVNHGDLQRVDGGFAVETRLGSAPGAPVQTVEVPEGEPRRVPTVDSRGAGGDQDPLPDEIEFGLVRPHPGAHAQPVVGGPEDQSIHARQARQLERVRSAEGGLDHQPKRRCFSEDAARLADGLGRLRFGEEHGVEADVRGGFEIGASEGAGRGVDPESDQRAGGGRRGAGLPEPLTRPVLLRRVNAVFEVEHQDVGVAGGGLRDHAFAGSGDVEEGAARAGIRGSHVPEYSIPDVVGGGIVFAVDDGSFAAFGRDAGQFSRRGPEDRRSQPCPRSCSVSEARNGNRLPVTFVWVDMMRLRHVPPLSRATAAIPLALILTLAALPALGQEKPWLHVQVEGDDDGTKVEVNLPLAAIEALGGSLGERMLDEMAEEWEHDSDLDVDSEDLRAFWSALRENPGAWVQIDEEDGGNLRARMDGDQIRIEGGGDDGSLDIRFPVAFVDALFGEAGSEPDLGAAIRSLANHEDVLISVDGDDAKVRVWIEPR